MRAVVKRTADSGKRKADSGQLAAGRMKKGASSTPRPSTLVPTTNHHPLPSFPLTVGHNDTELLYREDILDHYRHPHNFGMLKKAAVSQHEFNPTCGDDLTMQLSFDAKGRISEARFHGRGCAISTAAASMLTDELRGMKSSDVNMMGPADIFRMLGVEVGLGRIKCALLALRATHAALAAHSLTNPTTKKVLKKPKR